MGGKKLTAKTIKRKNAPTHPGSRRAAQLQRVNHRAARLATDRSVRNRTVGAKVERLSQLILLLPPDWAALPDLPALHSFLQTSFLTRHNAELVELQANRRTGRPPTTRETALKEVIERERRDYEAGIEIPDLLSEANVKLLREWEGDEGALGLFRHVRVSGKYLDQYTLVNAGLHKDLAIEKAKLATSGTKDASAAAFATAATAPAAPAPEPEEDEDEEEDTSTAMES